MIELLNNLPGTVAVIGAVIAFLIQYAALVWRVSKAEAEMNEKIATIERNCEIDSQKIRNEIVESKLSASNTYMQRETLKEIISNIDSRLIRLEGKLDAAIALKAVSVQ